MALISRYSFALVDANMNAADFTKLKQQHRGINKYAVPRTKGVDDENNAHIVYCDSEDNLDTAGPVKLYYVTDKTGEWVRHEVDFTP